MKLNFICAFSVLICLLFSFSTTAQQETIYRDTTSHSSFSTSGSSSRYKSIRVGNYQNTRYSEEKITYPTNFPNTKWGREVNFPKDFQTGFDSIFTKDATQSEFVLSQIWTYQDKTGTAKWEIYHPDGQLEQLTHYIGQELDTMITIDSTYDEPIEFNPDDSEDVTVYREHVLDEKDWKRDTQYAYNALREGLVQGWYENGSLSFTQTFKNGVLHGKTTVYHENGNLAETFVHENGKIVGLRESWYEDNQKRLETNIHDENSDRYHKEWYKNGNLKTEATRYGLMIRFRTWFENGNPQEIATTYQDDTLDIYQLYYQNGQIKMSGRYDTLEWKEDSTNLLVKIGDAFERVASKMENDSVVYYDFPFEFYGFTFRSGKFQYWNENGKLLFEEFYRLGKLEDRIAHVNQKEIMDFYYPPAEKDCQIKVHFSMPKDAQRNTKTICTGLVEHIRVDTIQAEYKMPGTDTMAIFTDIITLEGKLGKCVYESYYPNGQIQMRLHYKEDNFDRDEEIKLGWRYTKRSIPAGSWTYWYPNGNIKWEKNYLDADYTTIEVVLDEKHYYKNGQIKSEVYQVASPIEDYYNAINISDEGTHREWFENGQLKTETHYFDGDKEGDEKHWNEDGILIKHFQYKEDKLFSWQKYYNDDGKLIKKEYYLNGKLEKMKEMK